MTDNELYHHGILGMKWGIRRFQNSDGSLTSLGQSHRDVRESRFDFDSLKKSATDFINANKGKSFSEMKIDALDYMNRKGVMDLFDASADAPFDSIREGMGDASKYQSSSKKDFAKALENLQRYNDALGRKKNFQRSDIAKEGTSFEKMKDYYLEMDKKTGYKGLTKALLRDESNALADKKLGMLSKEARDIERAAMGKEFAKNLKDMSVNELSASAYKDAKQRENPFTGQMTKTKYEEVYVPEHWEETEHKVGGKFNDHSFRYYKMGENDTRTGVWDSPVDWGKLSEDAGYGYTTEQNRGKLPDKVFYPFNDEGYADVPKYTYTPESTISGKTFVGGSMKTVVTGFERTQEYKDYLDTIKDMPGDYSHITSQYSSTVDLGKDWMNQLSHDDLTEDFLAHHGIMGMHWGERKYQNADGSLTEEGRRHYGVGPAREFAKKIGDTAKRAGEAVSTAARKTFKPTSEDMDEKLAKAYEKQAIKDKKNELRALKGHNKKMKDMSDQEVWQKIQSRNNRKTLEQMRNDASTIRQGGKFVAGMASTAAKPIGALAKMGAEVALDSAKYGLTRAARSAIDDAVENASKKRRLENRTDSEKLRDQANDVRNKTDIQRMESENRMRSLKDETEARRMISENRMRDARDTNELHRIQAEEDLRSTKTSYEKAKMENDINRFASETSLREAKNASERTKAQRDAAVNFLEYQTAMGSEGSSQYSAERLQRLKTNRVSDNNNSGGGNKNKNKNKNKS